MAGKDPMMSALDKLKKQAPDEIKNDKKFMSQVADLEKTLKAKDKSFSKKLSAFIKSLGVTKKNVKADKKAAGLISEIEKIALYDQKVRLKPAKVKTRKPS